MKKSFSRKGAEMQREEQLTGTVRPTLDTGDFRFRDLEGVNGREQDAPATMGRAVLGRDECVPAHPRCD